MPFWPGTPSHTPEHPCRDAWPAARTAVPEHPRRDDPVMLPGGAMLKSELPMGTGNKTKTVPDRSVVKNMCRLVPYRNSDRHVADIYV